MESFNGKKVLITGAVGFIGSHLAERLLISNATVLGVDCLSDYYAVERKKQNLRVLSAHKNFQFRQADICVDNLDDWMSTADYIFHLAAQPGVRHSWGQSFDVYVNNNVLATQKILESAVKNPQLKKFIYASSSSIYGNVAAEDITEDQLPQPISPYGVTKLAGENLVYAYFKNYSLPAFSARFFTVYGPRQRPDMAFQKLIECALKKEPFVLYGDGTQQRDFTFVEDVVESLLRLTGTNQVGDAVNIGGGHVLSMNQIFETLENLLGHKIELKKIAVQKGDVTRTNASIEKLQRLIGYAPSTPVAEGLARQIKCTQMM